VRLLMTSRDVLHSFYVPDFRIKQDVLPGRYTETWFEATKPGRYQILCAEYCGTWHSQMWGEVVVMPGPSSTLDGRAEGGPRRARRHGRRRRRQHARLDRRVRQEDRDGRGLPACHSLDGQPHIGPTWLDLYLRREPLESGEAVVADEAYLTDSMIDPRAKVVRGFKPIMPTYKGRLAAPEAAALVEFIKSLRSTSLENLPAKEATYEPAKPARR
jgi:cytochrome c oxidase subunit 2